MVSILCMVRALHSDDRTRSFIGFIQRFVVFILSFKISIECFFAEPARFEQTSHNMTARRDAPATLACEVRGDSPIQVNWAHNMNHLDLNTYR